LGEVMQQFAGCLIVNDGSDRDFDHGLLPVVAGPVAALSVPAAFAFVFRIVTEMQQRILMRIGDQDDIAATASVPAAGTAAGHVFLPAERKTTVPAVTGFNVDANFVDEHKEKRRPDRPGRRRKDKTKERL